MNARKRLERELTLVLARLRGMDDDDASRSQPAAPAARAAGSDEIDLAQADQRREVDLLTRARLLERVEQLHDALDRVENDTYGICLECDQPIHAGRLRVLPEAGTCVRCQERREQAVTAGRRVA